MSDQPCKSIEIIDQYDVLVCGGGTAGTIAAIQAARAGAKTVLVECGSQLGGTMTTGSVSFPGLFHAYGQQIIKGIGWELVEETVKMNGDVLQDFTKPYWHHPEHQINLNPYLYALLCEEKCTMAGVLLRYYETPVKAVFDGSRWVVDVMGKGTQVKYSCNQLIDCTGNALLAQIAGYDIMRSDTCQPGSIMFRLAGYDTDRLDMMLIQEAYQKAIQDGKFAENEFLDIISMLKTAHYKTKANTFSNHVHGADSTTSKTHTVTNLYGRDMLLRMLRFLKTLQGLENITLYSMAPETSIRETNRIHGLHIISVDEYVNAKQYEDGICHAFYPLDLHDKAGIKPRPLTNDLVPSIPLRALIPKNSKNFLVAGRCVSSDQMANSALRVEAPCMAMGQAAGATAALASKRGLSPHEIPISKIHKLLCEHEAIIPKHISFNKATDDLS